MLSVKVFTARTYNRALEIAIEKLTAGKSIIVDASFKRRRERTKFYEAAKRTGSDFFIIECQCPDNVVKERLERRAANTMEASDGRWEIYQAQKDTFEEINELPDISHIVIDTSLMPEENTYRILLRIKNLIPA